MSHKSPFRIGDSVRVVGMRPKSGIDIGEVQELTGGKLQGCLVRMGGVTSAWSGSCALSWNWQTLLKSYRELSMFEPEKRKFRVGDEVKNMLVPPDYGRVFEVGNYVYLVGVSWEETGRSYIEDTYLELAEPTTALSRAFEGLYG